MQSTFKTPSLIGLVAAFVLLCGGCVTGPQYTFAQQKDSASVEGPVGPVQKANNGSSVVQITKIDGLAANFVASSPGVNWPLFEFEKRLFFAPGKHELVLNISEVNSELGDTGHGNIGTVSESHAGSRPTVTVEFAARHAYRFTAQLNESVIDLTLWDETDGLAARKIVANWTLDSNASHQENTFRPVHNRS